MKRAIRFTTLFICASLALMLMTPTVLGLTRRTHLSNFINSTQTFLGGYQSTTLPVNKTAGSPDLISTAYAINMSVFFGKTSNNFLDTTSWILDHLKISDYGFRITPSETTATMMAMYLAALALNLTKGLISLGSPVRQYITDLHNGTSGGFHDQRYGITTTLATFYAVESLYYLNNASLLTQSSANGTSIGNYFLNCYNSDGGFAEIIGKESTLEGTWAALSGLYRLSTVWGVSLSSLVDPTKSGEILKYVSQFYFASESDAFNYGGYGTSGRAMVRDTFYAQTIYAFLGTENPNKTQVQNYILGCQNIADGGFAEKNILNTYRTSSILTSYYAFAALKTIDNQLAMLNVEVWFLPFDLVLLLIVLGVVVVVIAIGVHYYRKRRE